MAIWISSWQTPAHGPNLACHLVLNGLQVENGFYIFRWLKEKKNTIS